MLGWSMKMRESQPDSQERLTYHCQMDPTILKDLRLGIAVLLSDRDMKASLPVQTFDWKVFAEPWKETPLPFLSKPSACFRTGAKAHVN